MDMTKFFDRNKRELSSNPSVDETAAKKQHEESLNNSMGIEKFAKRLKVSRMC